MTPSKYASLLTVTLAWTEKENGDLQDAGLMLLTCNRNFPCRTAKQAAGLQGCPGSDGMRDRRPLPPHTGHGATAQSHPTADRDATRRPSRRCKATCSEIISTGEKQIKF